MATESEGVAAVNTAGIEGGLFATCFTHREEITEKFTFYWLFGNQSNQRGKVGDSSRRGVINI